MTNHFLDRALVARVLLAFMFILAGWGKLGDIQGTMAYAASGGLPGFFVFPAIARRDPRRHRGADRLADPLGGARRLPASPCWPRSSIHYVPAQGLEGYDRLAQILIFQKNLAITGGFLLLATFGPGRLFARRAGRSAARRRLSPFACLRRRPPDHRGRCPRMPRSKREAGRGLR